MRNIVNDLISNDSLVYRTFHTSTWYGRFLTSLTKWFPLNQILLSRIVSECGAWRPFCRIVLRLSFVYDKAQGVTEH